MCGSFWSRLRRSGGEHALFVMRAGVEGPCGSRPIALAGPCAELPALGLRAEHDDRRVEAARQEGETVMEVKQQQVERQIPAYRNVHTRAHVKARRVLEYTGCWEAAEGPVRAIGRTREAAENMVRTITARKEATS